jgi:hypothetical protein
MLDRVDEARATVRAGEAQLREIGDDEIYFQAAHVEIERIVGDDEAAASWMQEAYGFGVDHDVAGTIATYGGMRAVTLCALDRHGEAEALASECRALSAEDDLLSQAVWRQAMALVDSHRGRHDEAQRRAREAVEMTRQTDSLLWIGDALVVLGRVLASAGSPDLAATELREASAAYHRKQVIPLVRRTDLVLNDLAR